MDQNPILSQNINLDHKSNINPNNIDEPRYDTPSEYEFGIKNPDDNSNIPSEKYSILQHKTELMEINNGWNDKNEHLIISIGENAASYKWMHEKCGNYYRIIQKILSIVLIIFSTGLSAETIIANDTGIYMTILRNVFTYIVTIVSVLQNFLKYEQLNEKHLTYASNFNKLYHDIQKQMCLYRRDRVNATSYVTEILKRYDSFIVNGPNITQGVINQFKKAFKDSDITIPDIADRIQKIEIINETNNNTQFQKNSQQHIQTLNQNQPNQSNQFNQSNQQQRNIFNKKDNTLPLQQENFGVINHSPNYNNTNMCNLQKIHNAFQIHGDITDDDIQNANYIELKELRKKFLKEKQKFEYQRFIQHYTEND